MLVYQNPDETEWVKLCERPTLPRDEVYEIVRPVIRSVRESGDNALQVFSERFDGISINNFEVTPIEIDSACNQVPEELKKSIRASIQRVRAFHAAHLVNRAVLIETAPGILCWSETVPIDRVGLYIPGGSAPLFSTVYMLGVPALLAGVPAISICTPCDTNGEINPIVLFTAREVGIEKIFKIGGAQAIAALAYGTDSIPSVDKIFGPGNQYVTAAKELVSLDGIAIDLPAGPSEVLVIADALSDPAWVAADLIAQAEHGEDSQVVLLTCSEPILIDVIKEIEIQVALLPRENIARQALEKSIAIYFKEIDTCFDFSNAYAPEHLILAVENPRDVISKVRNAGSVFLGYYSPEVAGDYTSGTNHCLPTGGAAKATGGVSVRDFQKIITFQEITKKGLQIILGDITSLAHAERLDGHAKAAEIRLRGE